ncbi:hypothetical protein N7490_008309 [Penicillium lividum]|nr:hypothetical protein N7490_008309 [Penicillium lividum]
MADKPYAFLGDARRRLFDEGLKICYEVAGKAYVDRSLSSASSFTQPMQELVTEAFWGSVAGGYVEIREALLQVAI